MVRLAPGTTATATALVRVAVGGALAALALAGCSKADPRPSDTAPPPAAKAGPPRAAAPGGVAAEGKAPAGPDTSFHLTAEQPAPTTAGGETVARLVVHPGEGYKMNKEFPTKLTLEPPAGVSLAKSVLEPADAERFSEEELTFAVKMTAPAAGEYTIPGTIKFAVCTETTCDPKKQQVALVLKAN